MDIFSFDYLEFMSFLLSLIRVSLIVFLLPFFGGDTIPNMVKAFLCIVLTLAIWPQLSLPGEFLPAHPANITILVLSEIVLGMLLGMLVQFIFVAFQLGGEVIGFQMGFSMISMADPSTGAQLVATSFLTQTVAMTIFLAMEGHLYVLSALMGSFKIIMPGQLFISAASLSDVITLSGQMFTLALKIAGPVIGCLFMVDLALALMAKAAPQMNLLMIGFPIKIAIGFVLMGITFSLIALFLDDYIRGLGPMFDNVMRAVRLRE
ncbi:MAG: flagellar biosynthetic protein FliR [Deltaproteobacteria bacterium]|jgi:flagellar biosynthetic protein FliR|nr:flagellar biosynthetic protein FliR [Deltaproteobacteria bacterium]